VLVPVGVELASPLGNGFVTIQDPAHELANFRLVEILRHPSEIVSALVVTQKVTICAAAVLLAGNPGIELELSRIVVQRLPLDADHLVQPYFLASR
jgi:hypothetical protein